MIVRDQQPLHSRTRDPGLHGVMLHSVWMLLLLLMTPLIAPSHAAEKDPLILTGPADVERLSGHFEYTIDPDWQLTIGDFNAPSAVPMHPLPGSVPDFGYTPARIWLRLPVVNATADVQSWRFFVHANFTQQIAIYKIASDRSVTTLLDLTEDTPFSARPIENPQMVAPVPLAPGESADLIVSYYSQGSSRLSMSVETQSSFAEQARAAQAKNYAFYGMMLVMIALATVAVAVLRQPVFAAYAGYLLSVLVYIAHADGTAFQYIWPSFPRFNSMASIVAGSSIIVFGGLFAITFLKTARYHPIMHRVLQGVVVFSIATDVVLWVADPQLLKHMLVVMISISVLICLTAGLIAARTRFREVRFYVLAWLAGLIPAFLLTSRFAFGIETAFITPYDAVRLALVFDALMMGLAISDRYNHMRQSAMEETLAQVNRNLALSQRLALLEQSYQQVTTNARQREESVKDTVHDLRQPMHALRLSLRQMFSVGEDKATDVNQIKSALGYMERLVAERLTDNPHGSVSDAAASADRVATAGDESEAEPSLHEVLRGVADMFAAEAAAKGLQLRLVLAAPDAMGAAYPVMRVVANLVSNAIKYTQQGRIVVALRRFGTGHRIEVHDTGPGLSGDMFKLALIRNQRLERDHSAAEGTGLGLAVVAEIVGANDWRINSCPGRRTGASIRVDISGNGR